MAAFPDPHHARQEFEYRTVSFTFEEATLPGALAAVVRADERLLRLSESGLPSWATLLPRTGLYYRPWLRRLTWILFYAFSVVSLAVGFYDLYRNLPGVQVRALSRPLLPGAGCVFGWKKRGGGRRGGGVGRP